MADERPIFVNGISRGGTTMLLNLLASHPAVGLVGETHKVFKGCRHNDSPLRVAMKCLFRELPFLVGTRMDFFSPRCDDPRPALGARLQRRLDAALFREKLRRHPRLNRDRGPDDPYPADELPRLRVLAKNLDGAIQLSDLFAEMYPQATFVSLIRNGFAVCEGHVRRGTPAALIGRRYRRLATKMLDDAAGRKNHLIVRFERMLRSPRDVLVQCCAAAKLDIWRVRSVRYQQRRWIQADGQHDVRDGREWSVHWLPLSRMTDHFDQEIDQRQAARLSDGDRKTFLREAGDVMERLGYWTAGRRRIAA